MELYKKLILSDAFKEWKSKNKDSFLCSYVSIQSPQFDFYNKDDTITSFAINDEIEIIENEKIYNKTDIKPIDLKKIKSSEERVADIAKKKYKKETFTKQIIILQNSKKQLWNLLFMTSSMKILNVKIDMNNKIISETFEPMTKFMKQVK